MELTKVFMDATADITADIAADITIDVTSRTKLKA